MTSPQIDNASAWLERWRKGHGLTKEERSEFDELYDVSDLSSDWVRFLEVPSASFEDVRRQIGHLGEIWEWVRASTRSSEAPDDTDASTQKAVIFMAHLIEGRLAGVAALGSLGEKDVGGGLPLFQALRKPPQDPSPLMVKGKTRAAMKSLIARAIHLPEGADDSPVDAEPPVALSSDTKPATGKRVARQLTKRPIEAPQDPSYRMKKAKKRAIRAQSLSARAIHPSEGADDSPDEAEPPVALSSDSEAEEMPTTKPATGKRVARQLTKDSPEPFWKRLEKRKRSNDAAADDDGPRKRVKETGRQKPGEPSALGVGKHAPKRTASDLKDEEAVDVVEGPARKKRRAPGALRVKFEETMTARQEGDDKTGSGEEQRPETGDAPRRKPAKRSRDDDNQGHLLQKRTRLAMRSKGRG